MGFMPEYLAEVPMVSVRKTRTTRSRSFGSYLRQLRAQQGYSLRQLAMAAGLQLSHLHRLEHDQTEPRLSDLRLLSMVLGITLSKLLEPFN
jgi:transcriptional regulator with XRE-family HTH domain